MVESLWLHAQLVGQLEDPSDEGFSVAQVEGALIVLGIQLVCIFDQFTQN